MCRQKSLPEKSLSERLYSIKDPMCVCALNLTRGKIIRRAEKDNYY